MGEEKGNLAKNITARVIGLLATEVTRTETQLLIKKNVIVPVINMIYAELYPYIISLIVAMMLILILSLLTFICFVLYYFRK